VGSVYEPKVEEFAIALSVYLRALQEDQRVGPVHLCMYLALFQCSGGREEWFSIEPKEVMGLAMVRGKTTYYQVMKDLVRWGYVEYRASRNWKCRSRVRMRWDELQRSCR